MADVRAEILAASRSRTGWLDQVGEDKSQPFIGSLKTGFDSQPTQLEPIDNMSSPTRLEPSRKLGTKVSTIANMFQALSPQKEENEQFKKAHVAKPLSVSAAKPRIIQDNKTDDETDTTLLLKQQPSVALKSTALSRTESHLTRFNNARAMFENLEQKKQTLSSPKRQPSSTSSSPIHSPLLLETCSSPLPPMQSSSMESLNNRSISVNQNLNQDISPVLSYDSPLQLSPESENGDYQNSSVCEQPSNANLSLNYDARKNLKGSLDSCLQVVNGKKTPNSAIDLESSKKTVDLLNASLQKTLLNDSDSAGFQTCPENNSSDCTSTEGNFADDSPDKHYNNKYIKPGARNNFSGQSSSSLSGSNHSPQYSDPRLLGKDPRLSNEFNDNDNWQVNDTLDMESLEETYYQEEACDRSEHHLRNSGGETLAEFECREQELFLVEAVLSSTDNQLTKSNSFLGSSVDDVELMTQEEADHLLSTSSRKSILSDDEAQEVELLLSQETPSGRSSFAQSAGSEDGAPPTPSPLRERNPSSGVDSCISQGAERQVVHEQVEYHVFSDGHYFHEVPGLQDESEEEAVFYCPVPPRRKARVRFSTGVIKVYSTHSIEDYDRHNDDVDPVSASAEYELEKRIENMDVFPVDIMKGPEGLGLSIIGMGVGADAGLEKLGIFIKTITESGAAHKDGRIRVNDQIIEVDGKSLVGVTQAYAASVLRNTSGLVRFVIGRDKEGANSEIAQLISMSLQADRESQENPGQYEGRSGSGLPPLPDPPERQDSQSSSSSSQSSTSSHDSTPDEADPNMDVFDNSHDSNFSPDGTPEILRVKVKEWQLKCVVTAAELKQLKAKTEVDRSEWQQQLDFLKGRLSETEGTLQDARHDIVSCKQHVEQTEQQCNLLQKKYTKAKKVIRQFQQREQDFIHQQEYHIQQIQEKDQEYNSHVKALKDRIILLEESLTDLQKQLGMTVTLPHDTTGRFCNTQAKTYQNSTFILTNNTKKLELEMSDPELSDTEGPTITLSPDEVEGNKRVSTLERHHINGEFFDKAVPQTELLDTSAAKSKAELASKGSLANRQPPTLKKQCSSNSIDEMILDESVSPGSSFSKSPLSQPETPLESPERLETSLCFRNSWVASGTESFSSKYANDIRQTMQEPITEEPDLHPMNETFLKDILPPDPSPATQQPSQNLQRVPVARFSTNGEMNNKTEAHQYQQSGVAYHAARANVAASIAAREKASTLPQTSNRRQQQQQQQPPRVPSAGFPAAGSPFVSFTDELVHRVRQKFATNEESSSSYFTKEAGRILGLDEPPLLNGGRDESFGGGHLVRRAPDSRPVQDGHYRDSMHGQDSRSRYSGSHLPPPPPEHQAMTASHQPLGGWQSRPVQDWSAEQVGQWLSAMGLAIHIPKFLESRITGQLLIQMDSARLKSLGVLGTTDRATLKKKLKDMRLQLERERKAHEKELKAKEKQMKKHSDKLFKKK